MTLRSLFDVCSCPFLSSVSNQQRTAASNGSCDLHAAPALPFFQNEGTRPPGERTLAPAKKRYTEEALYCRRSFYGATTSRCHHVRASTRQRRDSRLQLWKNVEAKCQIPVRAHSCRREDGLKQIQARQLPRKAADERRWQDGEGINTAKSKRAQNVLHAALLFSNTFSSVCQSARTAWPPNVSPAKSRSSCCHSEVGAGVEEILGSASPRQEPRRALNCVLVCC